MHEENMHSILRGLEKAARTPKLRSFKLDLQDKFHPNHWHACQNILNVLDPDSSNIESRVGDADLISRLTSSTSEINAMISILHILLDTAYGIKNRLKGWKKCVIPKTTIESLPDELLSIIFKGVVWEEGHRGAAQALSLSRVSRRFRGVALGEKVLWTTLYSQASNDELSAFIARAGPTEEFRVFIQFKSICKDDFSVDVMRRFVDVCEKTMSRWKAVILIPEGNWNYTVGVFLPLLDKRITENNKKYLPRLQELDVRGKSGGSGGDVPAWLTPNLRSLRCSYLIPYAKGVFSSVTAFAFTETLSRFDNLSRVVKLPAFLASMSNLASFELNLDLGVLESVCAKRTTRRILSESTCPSITSFQLRLLRFELSEDADKKDAVASLLQALRMPLLEDMAIDVEFREMGENENQCTAALSDLAPALIQNHLSETSPRLSSLTLKLSYNVHRFSRYPLEAFPRVFTIPLTHIPFISTLSLTSCARVLFTGIPRTRCRELDGRGAIRLSELKFCDCNNMGVEDLGWTVLSLQDAKLWDGIERVVVEGHERLRYEEILPLVGGNRLEYYAPPSPISE